MSPPILTARGLTRSFRAGRGGLFTKAPRFNAVDGVDIDVEKGETLGVVGESGSGKSTLGLLLTGLLAPSAGKATFNGKPVNPRARSTWRALRQHIQIVFQDAAGSLDPRLPVFAQVREALTIHHKGDAAERDARTARMLTAVGLGEHLWQSVPGELSGGQQQRVVIARAVVLRPVLLVCDEPVSALDVSIQAQVVAVLRDLQRELDLTVVFISHDLAVIRQVADRLMVMYLGKVIEVGAAGALIDAPLHPYTRALLAAVPVPDPARRAQSVLAAGEPPSPTNPPSGCCFHPRCPFATARCSAESPALRPIGRRQTACHHAEAIEAAQRAEAA